MNTTAFTSSRRRAAIALLAAGAGITGMAAGVTPADAAPAPHPASAQRAAAQPDGLFAIQSCVSMSGSETFQPGLARHLRQQTSLLTATLDGCSLAGSPVSGQGTLTAVLTGKASKTSRSLSGTYTINWPVAEGLNPSTGRITLSGPNLNVVTLGGTGTAGAFAGLPVGGAFFISGHTGRGTHRHPITKQTFVNTAPLRVLENLG